MRACSDFDPAKPLTWVFGAGFLALAVASATLYTRMERRAGQQATADRAQATEITT